MVTISLCMIVKNEERLLSRCLDSLNGLMDEVIIVDTGSTDKTKTIAAEYTGQIYDFVWKDDFAAARNFAFSKATCEYIYSADADEILDDKNREKFRQLKETILPEIEIVQMYYGNQLSFGTVYNYDRELRPKLFKHYRTFEWVDPVHETIRLSPLIFDSDIEITHLPERSHGGRDLQVIYAHLDSERGLSKRLTGLYARELWMTGRNEDFLAAEDYFTEIADSPLTSEPQMKEALCVVVKASAVRGDTQKFYRYALKDVATEAVSEICLELGEYYLKQELWEEAVIWFYNAAYETHSILDIHSSGNIPLSRLAFCYEKMGMSGQAEEYRKAEQNWKPE